MKLADLKTGVKLALGFLLVTLVFMGICFFMIFEMGNLKELEDRSAERAKDAIKIQGYEMYVDHLYVIIADSIINRDIAASRRDFTKTKSEIQDALAEVDKMSDTDLEKSLARDLRKGFDDYTSAYENQLLPDFIRGVFSLEKISNVDGKIDLMRDTLKQSFEKYSHLQIADQVKASTLFDENHVSTVRLSLIITGIGLLLAAFFAFIITRYITVRLGEGISFANKLASGDFTGRIELDQNDEFGELSRSLNKAADDLENLISEIIVASQNLAQAVEQIASGNENLSQRTSEQASSLEEIASTIEETTATIRQTADNALQMNKLAMETSGRSGEAMETSNEAVRISEEGGRIVIEAVNSMTGINKSSKKIEEILVVINEIAFQTNLLALNAAVEAARAGEQGRGFAVVAGEVRNLAQRSGNAAKEIGVMIKESIENIGQGTSMVNKSGDSLKEIINAVMKNSTSLDAIISSLKSVGQLVNEVAASSEEQKRGMDQINIAISEMDTMTQQNSALVEETASASEEMANQAQELLGMIEKFRIRETVKNQAGANKYKELHLKAAEIAGKKSATLKRLTKTTEKKIENTTGLPEKNNVKLVMREEGFDEF